MSQKSKNNYPCTKEFNCIVSQPITTEYSWFSNKDGLPSSESYFQPSSCKTIDSHETHPVDSGRGEKCRQKVEANNIRRTNLL